MKQSPLFSNIETGNVYTSSDAATYKGICVKTFILLFVAIIAGAVTAYALPTILVNNFVGFYIALIASSVIGTISVFIGRTSKTAAPYCSFIYSVCEGLFLGTITCLFGAEVRGIVVIAIVGTVTIFATMLALYALGILRVGSGFVKFCWAFTIGALALALVTSLLSLTGIFNSLSIGLIIGIEAIFLVYGSITLLLNFAEATNVVQAGCDKASEWNVALGLEVSVIYIYVELLRVVYLIAQSKRN